MMDKVNMFGGPFESGVYDQMKMAMSLPVAIRGALMPDAHQGYALPIGGVVDLNDAISPAFVGYDIACRMKFTAINISPEEALKARKELAAALIQSTSFGVGSQGKNHNDHSVMRSLIWDEIDVLKSLKGLAQSQLGSSGGGNHFADIVIGKYTQDQQEFVGLMTHSGSRGIGHKIATYYSGLAEAACEARVPKGYGYLRSANENAYKEYIAAMQLMDEYSSANHHIIHKTFCKVAGLDQKFSIENYHNLASNVGDANHDIWCHRKGATPAEFGVYGVIPGSSGTKSYLVKGKGNSNSLGSASHGAGRTMSRSKAKQMFNNTEFQDAMSERDIDYYGVGPDETFKAYKDIEAVMAAQKDCVEIIAEMKPIIVVMGGKADDGD